MSATLKIENARQRQVYRESILYWVAEARKFKGSRWAYARKRAWANALDIASAHPDFEVDLGKAGGSVGPHPKLYRITRIGARGAMYAKRICIGRDDSREQKISGPLWKRERRGR